MTVSMDQVKELRAQTGVGVMDAKQALADSDGDMDKAYEWLREHGKAKAAKKADRETNEGAIASYVHTNNRVGVMVALQCETDFVAKNDRFLELARNIAMHIAAMSPTVVNPEDVPEAEVQAEREMIEKELAEEDKPDDIKEKIIDGKLKKFREERALLTQAYVKDTDKTVQELIEAAIQELGENITVREFCHLTV